MSAPAPVAATAASHSTPALRDGFHRRKASRESPNDGLQRVDLILVRGAGSTQDIQFSCRALDCWSLPIVRTMPCSAGVPEGYLASIQPGDVVIVPIVNGTFSVSLVAHSRRVGSRQVGSVGSKHDAILLACRHRLGGQIWLVGPSGGVVLLDCPALGNT